ncbi:MAG TPA: MFS transporter, partial [Thermomicrobiaceae bacterium]|nr:MFS transporter [Thermomicrobiaceae bacterium]
AFPLVFVSTCLFSLFRPALNATVPAAAHGQDNLVQANALMSQIDGLALLLGPALAGLLLLGGLGRLAFVINAATYMASTLTLLQLRIPPREGDDRQGTGHWLDETLEGWRFLRHQGRGVLMAVTMTSAGGSCFNGAIWTLAVVMAEQTWHTGSQGAGFLTSCIGIGGLVGGLGIGIVTGRMRLGQGYIRAMAGTIAGIALLGIAPAGPLPFIVITCCGLFDVINQILGNTIIQQSTPDELLGRVFGIFEAIVVTGLLAGSLAVGLLIDTIGPRATTAGLALVPLAFLLIYLPGLRHLDAPAGEPMAEMAVGASADAA